MCSLELQPAEPEMVVFLPVEDLPAGRDESAPTYYDEPSLKESPYHWKTALSFLAEAVGGGPQVLAALIDLAGNDQDRGLVRAGRYLALAGSLAAPGLLISELHTPRRWLHMLRIFRPTSAMSIGNLSLTALGLFSGLTALGQLLEDRGRRRWGLLARSLQLPAALAGAMICLYPGTELEETSVALWAGSHPLLAPLFAATGLSAGAATLTLAARGEDVPEESRDRLNNLAVMVLAVQLTQALLVEKAWHAHRFPSQRNTSRGPMYRLGVLFLGVAMPLVLRLLPGQASRRQENRTVAAATTLAGSYLLYEAVLEAGNSSAVSAGDSLGEARAGRRAKPRASNLPGILGLTLLTAAGAALFLLKRRSS